MNAVESVLLMLEASEFNCARLASELIKAQQREIEALQSQLGKAKSAVAAMHGFSRSVVGADKPLTAEEWDVIRQLRESTA